MAAEIDEAKLGEFMGQMVGHMTGGALCFGVWLGDELGLYRVLAGADALIADDVAAEDGCNPRLVREWLDGQVAGGLVGYDAATDRYELSPEAAMALADDNSPVFVARAMNAFGSMFIDIDKIATAFRGDGALSWGDHHPCLFSGTEWFFRTGYRAELPSWIAALDGVADQARRRRHRRRRRLRPRRVGRRARPGLPERAASTASTSTPRRSTTATAAGRRGRCRRPHDLRGRRRQELRRHLRPDLLLRLPARHGRPGRHRPLRPRAPRPGGTVLLVEPFALDDRPPTSPTTRWPRCSTPRRRASAHRTRCRRRSASASAHKRARPGCATCSSRPASRTSGAPPRHRSTSSSKPAPDRDTTKSERTMECLGMLIRRTPPFDQPTARWRQGNWLRRPPTTPANIAASTATGSAQSRAMESMTREPPAHIQSAAKPLLLTNRPQPWRPATTQRRLPTALRPTPPTRVLHTPFQDRGRWQQICPRSNSTRSVRDRALERA